ncbi:hypothetical protein HID58_074788, partial [Brassica napus]
MNCCSGHVTIVKVWLRDNSFWVLRRVCSHGLKLQQRFSSG